MLFFDMCKLREANILQNFDILGGPLNIFQQSSNFECNNTSGDRTTVRDENWNLQTFTFMRHPNICLELDFVQTEVKLSIDLNQVPCSH